MYSDSETVTVYHGILRPREHGHKLKKNAIKFELHKRLCGKSQVNSQHLAGEKICRRALQIIIRARYLNQALAQSTRAARVPPGAINLITSGPS